MHAYEYTALRDTDLHSETLPVFIHAWFCFLTLNPNAKAFEDLVAFTARRRPNSRELTTKLEKHIDLWTLTQPSLFYLSQYLLNLTTFLKQPTIKEIFIGEEENLHQESLQWLEASGFVGTVFYYLTQPSDSDPVLPHTYDNMARTLSATNLTSLQIGGMYLNPPLSYSLNFKQKNLEGETLIELPGEGKEVLAKGCVNGFIRDFSEALTGRYNNGVRRDHSLRSASLSPISLTFNLKPYYAEA